MPTQKRRVVYLSDEAWEAAKRQAEPFALSISAYIQSLIIGGRIASATVVHQFETIRLVPDEDVVDFGLGTTEQQVTATERIAQGKPGTTVLSPQAERDAILHKINRGNS